MKNIQIELIILLLLFFISLNSCSGQNKKTMIEKYGKDYNGKRAELHLWPLPENWRSVPVISDNHTIRWVNPDGDLSKSKRLSKTVYYNNDKIVYEEDNLISGRFYKPNIPGYDKADQNESVTMRCYFDRYDQIDHCEYYYSGENSNIISKSKFFKIVENWGIRRDS